MFKTFPFWWVLNSYFRPNRILMGKFIDWLVGLVSEGSIKYLEIAYSEAWVQIGTFMLSPCFKHKSTSGDYYLQANHSGQASVGFYQAKVIRKFTLETKFPNKTPSIISIAFYDKIKQERLLSFCKKTDLKNIFKKKKKGQMKESTAKLIETIQEKDKKILRSHEYYSLRGRSKPV